MEAESPRGELDWKALHQDVREQLSGCNEALFALRDRCADLRVRVLSLVEQGQGLTHEELVELHERLCYVISPNPRKRPERTTASSPGCPRDTDGDGNCGRPFCPVCGVGMLTDPHNVV